MGWRDVQAKIESGELDYRRPAKSNFDIFSENFGNSFVESMREKRREDAEEKRYQRNRQDKLDDEARADKRALARAAEERRQARADAALAEAKEAEKAEKARLKNAKLLLQTNGKDATNPNFLQFAMDHVEAYGDNFNEANEAFSELLPRITEVGPMQGPLLSRDDINVETSLESTRRAASGNAQANPGDSEMFPDPAGIDAQMQEVIKDRTNKSLEEQGATKVGQFRDAANDQMDEILGTGKASGVRSALRAGESGGKTDAVDFNKEDGKDHVGLYQIGQDRLDDYNQANNTNYTVADLKTMDAEQQERIADWHFDDIDSFIDSNGLEKYIGETIGGVEITRSGLIAMAHLGGKGGMKRFLESDGEYNPNDSGSGVEGNSLADYAKKFGGLDATTTRASDGVGEAAEEDRYASFAIDPRGEPAFKFADLTKDNYKGIAEDYRRKGDEELANKIETFGSNAFEEDKKKNKLTDSDYAALVAEYTRMRSSTEKADRDAAEAWFKNEEPALRAGLEAAKGIGDKPSQEIFYIVTDGKRIAARKGEGGAYIPIDPNDGESIPADKVSAVDTEESVELIKDSLNSVSTQTKAQRDKMLAAVSVTEQGYELSEMAENNPVILTMVGAGQSKLVGAKREVEALFNIIGGAQDPQMDQGTVLEQIEDYITNNIDPNDAAAYKQFSAAMVRYIFAAGKALGQEGNGFSNQDYNNIRGAMFAGNGVEGFVQNLQRFARQRLADATSSAITLKNSGQIQFGIENGASFGSDLWTAKEHFENTNPDGLLPDYFAWANTKPQPKAPDVVNSDEQTMKQAQKAYDAAVSFFTQRDLEPNYEQIARILASEDAQVPLPIETIIKVMGDKYPNPGGR